MWVLAISPPLLHTVNRNFGTIWTKLPNIRQCPLSKIASFVSTERFSLLYAFNSALYMLQNPLTVLSFIGRLFDPNFLATAAGPLMAVYFPILNLSWLEHFQYGFCFFCFLEFDAVATATSQSSERRPDSPCTFCMDSM